MRDYKLIAVVIMVFITIFSISGYISANKQNMQLSRNLESILFRVKALESNQALQHLSELRSENAFLKEQIATLKTEIGRVVKENETLAGAAQPAPVVTQQVKKPEKPRKAKKAAKQVKPKAEKKAPEPPPVKKPKTQDTATGGNRGIFFKK